MSVDLKVDVSKYLNARFVVRLIDCLILFFTVGYSLMAFFPEAFPETWLPYRLAVGGSVLGLGLVRIYLRMSIRIDAQEAKIKGIQVLEDDLRKFLASRTKHD